ncbi:hypothetical protein [Actinomadura rifamycini]|uniref:hypothetical protein n=1 Tax=Actinomadura rifamycini TaxID=31962 RepID=UPI0003F6077D|nr:hypothetical protein [Actinomadura rifamycini]
MSDRTSRKAVAVAVTWLLLGIAGVLGAVATVLVAVPGRLADQAAFDAARDCPAAPREPADCLWKQEFAISDIRLYSGRGSEITATLTDRAGDVWPTEYRTNEPLLDDLDDGDTVVGTIWLGEVVRIAAPGGVQETTANPGGFAESAVGTALVAGPTGLLLIVASGWRLKHRTRESAPRGLTGFLWFTGGQAAGSLALGLLVIVQGWSVWLIPGLWPVMAAPLAGLTALAVRKADDLSAALGGTGSAPAP